MGRGCVVKHMKKVFLQYWSQSHVNDHTQLPRPDVFVGELRIDKRNGQLGRVSIQEDMNIELEGNMALNRAFHGDIVAVLTTLSKGNRWTGQVVRIMEACGCRRLHGTVRGDMVMSPTKQSWPRVKVRGSQPIDGMVVGVVVTTDDWPDTKLYAECHVHCYLGNLNSRETCRNVSMFELGLPIPEFSPEVLAAAETIGFIAEDDLQSRIDFREYNVMTIDDLMTDIRDDGIHVRQMDEDNIEVGIHLADASHFICPGSVIYQDCVQRVANGYFGKDLRTTMMPTLLSAERLSLVEGHDRLATTFLFTMSSSATIKHVNVLPSVIRVKHNFSYEQAQTIIDGYLAKMLAQSIDAVEENTADDDCVGEDLMELLRIARLLGFRRQEDGASFSPPDLRVLDDDEICGSFIVCQDKSETHFVIEEFSLLTNLYAAQFLTECTPCSILRKQQKPDDSAFAVIREMALYQDLSLDFTCSTTLYQSIADTWIETKDGLFTSALQQLMRDTVTSASVYCCSNEAEHSHYGLNVSAFCHFTSPLRRLGDLVCHHQLKLALGLGTSSAGVATQPDDVKALCEHINRKTKDLNLAVTGARKLLIQLDHAAKAAELQQQAAAAGVSDEFHGPQEVAYVLNLSIGRVKVVIPKFDSRFSLKVPSSLPDVCLENGKMRLKNQLICVGQRIIIEMDLDTKGKLCLKLVYPQVDGFSIPPRAAFDDETKDIEPDRAEEAPETSTKKPRLR